jgi:hypothetical protein
MAVASAGLESAEIPRPPVRLRSLLALALLGLAIWALYPRAVAAWKLHAAAVALADYAVCMVADRASLLRTTQRVSDLVRRRLISADAAEHHPTVRPPVRSQWSDRASPRHGLSFLGYGGVG